MERPENEFTPGRGWPVVELARLLDRVSRAEDEPEALQAAVESAAAAFKDLSR